MCVIVCNAIRTVGLISGRKQPEKLFYEQKLKQGRLKLRWEIECGNPTFFIIISSAEEQFADSGKEKRLSKKL